MVRITWSWNIRLNKKKLLPWWYFMYNCSTGKKQYERDFLLQLQRNPLSLKKPVCWHCSLLSHTVSLSDLLDLFGSIWYHSSVTGCHAHQHGDHQGRGPRGPSASCCVCSQVRHVPLFQFFRAHNPKWDMFLNSILPGFLLPHNGILVVWATSRPTTSLEEHQTEGRRSKTLQNYFTIG